MQVSRDSIRPIDAYALDEAVVACDHIDRDSVRALIADAPVVEAVATKYGVWEPVTEEITIPGGAKAQSLTGYRCPQCGNVEKFKKTVCSCGMRMM